MYNLKHVMKLIGNISRRNTVKPSFEPFKVKFIKEK